MCTITKIVFLLNSVLALCGASLVKTPSNKAVIVGQRMEMECQTDNRSLFRKWDFLQVGSDTPRTIATNDKSNISIVTNMPRFGVHLDQKGSIVLYSNSTESKDAGVYICQGETGSTEFKYSAQMIVIETEPICETNVTAKSSLEVGDYIWMQCRVSFRGNWAPTMEWRQHQVNAGINEERLVSDMVDTVVIQNSSITSILIVLINSTNYDSYYSCRTFFTWHNGKLRTNATNVPDFNHTWITSSTAGVNSRSTSSPVNKNATVQATTNADKFLIYTCLVLVFVAIVAIVGLIACRRNETIRKVLVISRATSMSKYDSLSRQLSKIIRPRARNVRSTANSRYSDIEFLSTTDAKLSVRERLAIPLPASHPDPFQFQPTSTSHIEFFNTTDAKISVRERLALPLPTSQPDPIHLQPIFTPPDMIEYEILDCRIKPENSDIQHPTTTSIEASVTVHSADVETIASQAVCSGVVIDQQKAFDSVKDPITVKAEIVYDDLRKPRLVTSPSATSDEEMSSSYLMISDEHDGLVTKVSVNSI